MKFAGSPRARIEVAKAKALVIAVAEELKVETDPERAFQMLWELGFVDLRKLEDFRIP